jgi:hypothetical protein
MGAWKTNPIVQPIDPWHRPGDLTFVQTGAKLINYTNVPIHRPGVQGWKGHFEFDETSGLYIQCNRGLYTKGTRANLFKIANFDVGAFDKAPSTMAVELGNVAPLMFVSMLNGAFSQVPLDRNGNPPDDSNNVNLIIAKDQIYGGSLAKLPATSLPAWAASTTYVKGQKVNNGGYIYLCTTGGTSAGSGGPTTTSSSITDNTVTWKYLFATSAQTPNLVNPANPDLFSGQTWTNAHENYAITPENILQAIINQQQRPAMNGVELGLGDEGVEIWVPFASKEMTRQYLEVFRQLPGTGTVPQAAANQVPINGSAASQVIFSMQDNPTFGRAKVRAITGLRPDFWCVVSPRPQPLPQYSLFVHAIGGTVGEYAVQDDPMAIGGDTVPHIAVYQFAAGTSSPMFVGAMKGTNAGDIGIAMLLNEGYAFGSGILIDVCSTGYMS